MNKIQYAAQLLVEAANILRNISNDESADQSSLTNNYKPKGHLSISKFKRVSINDPKLYEFIKEHPEQKYDSNGKFINWLKMFYRDYGDGLFYIDEENQKQVGYIFVNQGKKRDIKSKGVINGFHIFPDYRGYGLSNQILKLAISELGGDSLWVYKDNKIAYNLYIKLGFVTTYETKDEYFMELKK